MATPPLPTERITQHAPDLTHLLRPFLIARLDLGEIFFRKVGPFRRSHLAKLVAYKYAITQR